jgi:predicted enzyme related to lactoylglutathione lyase
MHRMNTNELPEFRFYYFTSIYKETVSFYRDQLQWDVFRSWDRGPFERGTIFRSPNGTGFIEIEEGNELPVIQGSVYIQVKDVDAWYEKITRNNITIIQPLTDTSYGHRSFKFADPNKLIIGLFKYIE